MTSPTVSVLVPCFNAEDFVGAALDSVLAQTFPPAEVIVVDDGSTDGSAAVIARYRDRGVKVIRQANAGASAARNRAFLQSRGSHVLWLDADDWIGPDHIARLASRAAERSDAIAFSRWGRFFDDPANTKPESRPSQADLPGVEWLISEWQDGTPMMQSGMFLIPRAHVAARGGWNEGLSLIDDFEFFARLIAGAPAMRFAHDALLCYRSGLAGSLSGQISHKAAESSGHSLRLGTDHLLASEDSPRTRRIAANILMTFEYTFYPQHPDLRAAVAKRIAELGGSDLHPVGPPGFHQLRQLIGWRAARRIQRFAERHGLNGVRRRQTMA